MAATGSSRTQVLAAFATAAALVVARSLVFTIYEHAFFDSDQAIIGLMAKHLVEGRAFPLFYYGQGYLLGIDAIAAVPIFLVMGPTVAALHVAIVLLNVAAVATMIAVLVGAGLRPWMAVAATAFFSFAPPLTSASFIEAGANIGPIVAVPLLWLLRDRPLAFGFVAALGFVNREFTLYGPLAVLALDVLDVASGRFAALARLRHWLVVAVAAAAVLSVVSALRPFADSNGPGTRGARPPGFSGSSAVNIASRMAVDPAELPARATAMWREHLPELFGLRPVDSPIAKQGHAWLFGPFYLGLAVLLGGGSLASGRATCAGGQG